MNLTPGSGTNRDHTTPSIGGKYMSSKELYKELISYEQTYTLCGNPQMIHIGTYDERTDKFYYYYYIQKSISVLRSRGYEFVLLPQLIGINMH